MALYRHADAVVTYGPHVSDYVAARGARNVHIAPQAVDNAYWSAPGDAADVARAAAVWPGEGATKFLFVGRPAGEKASRCCYRPGVPQASQYRPPRSSSSAWDLPPLGSPPAARWSLRTDAAAAR